MLFEPESSASLNSTITSHDSISIGEYSLTTSALQYDCSSADINPIGSISKQDLRRFLKWAGVHLGFSSLEEIEAAPPTAELEPIRSDYSQVGT